MLATHGRPELLAQALPTMAGDLEAGDELVVVESGGRRAAPVVAAADSPATVRHLVTDEPGKSWKLNRGVEATRCPIVLFTDDDCAVEPGWAEAMAEPFHDLSLIHI